MSDSPSLSLVLEAISFAARAHLGQLRKDGQTPYAAHPLRVMTILQQVFRVTDPETLAAAALHDVIEDTTTDFDDLEEQFGARVAGYVALLSKDSRLREDEREAAYRAALAVAPIEVKLCKLGDMYDNLADCGSGMSPHFRDKTARKMRAYLEALEQAFPSPWHHALQLVTEKVAELTKIPPATLDCK